jgi:two-component system cell cycle response regulator
MDTTSIVKGLEIGLNDYIASPVDVNELLARVKTQIKRKKYQDALRTNFRTSVSLAVTDGLTGLYNRRYMDTHLENMMKECSQTGKSMCAMMLDIDNFKEVNDTHGHDVGDEIIRQFSDRISQNMRPADMVVRYGGEEFTIFLPGTNLENGALVAERIRQRVANLPYQVNIANKELNKTCSIGITTLNRAGGDTPEMLLKRIDDALLEAKRTGKNKVVALANSFPNPQEAITY